MAVLTQYLVLSQQKTLDSTHQRTALAGEVGSCLALEGGLEHVAGTDTDTQSQSALEGTACSVLIYGIRTVQATAFKEHGAERGTGTLGGNHDNIDVLLGNTTGAVAPCDGETVREVQGLACAQVLLQGGPYAHYGRIGEQAHNDACLVGSLLDGEQGFTGNPTVGNSLLIGLTLTLANDNVETVVAEVASLTRALNAIADNGDGLVLQDFTCFLKRKLLAGYHFFDNAAKIHFCHCLCIFKIVIVCFFRGIL